MGYETIGILVLTCASTLMAQSGTPERFQAEHAREDETWAKKTGLPASEVRAIRVAAGISDSTPVTHIDSIDTNSLKQRNQILLVDGICVSLHVLERRADGFHQVSLLGKLPLPGWTNPVAGGPAGRAICSQAPQSVRVHVTPDSRIVVEVPILLDPFERSIPVSSYTFSWDGSQYKLTDESR